MYKNATNAGPNDIYILWLFLHKNSKLEENVTK